MVCWGMSRFKIDGGHGNGYSPGAYYKESPQTKIDPNNDADLEKWEASLQVDRKTLLAAIKAFGTGVTDIRRGLLNQKSQNAA